MTLKALRNAQIEVLKRAIARRHAELLDETREDVERARDESYAAIAGSVTDLADRASADLLADLGQAEISRDLRVVSDLEAALARIEAGTYGYCTQCGAEIAWERLRAWPVATRCTHCQIAHERTFAHPREPRL
jgi:RNA polymerase-binding transcription factor